MRIACAKRTTAKGMSHGDADESGTPLWQWRPPELAAGRSHALAKPD